MTHLLGDLMTGNWSALGRGQSVSSDRIAALASQLVAAGRTADESAALFFIPGRIEVLGKHTDYAGGRSLIAATEQGISMISVPRRDPWIRMIDIGRGQVVEFEIGAEPVSDRESWTVYPRTVARRLARAVDPNLTGSDIAFESTLPASAGLSSSSVLMIATFMALQQCNHLDRDSRLGAVLHSREKLAAFLGAVENGRPFGPFGSEQGVGTQGGDQDHTAILCVGAGEIRQYRFLPTLRERILRMPPGFIFAVAVSGIQANKTGAAQGDYNRISNLAVRLEELWRSRAGGSAQTLGSIVGNPLNRVGDLEAVLEGADVEIDARRDLRRRLDQFRQETEEIIPGAGDALALGDLATFGSWVDKSMHLATELLGNQIEETVWLAAAARDLGAVAASAFGAGFGGAVWAMVRNDDVESFLGQWSSGYLEQFPERGKGARFLKTVAGGPAAEL